MAIPLKYDKITNYNILAIDNLKIIKNIRSKNNIQMMDIF